jgi:hypothetical protein
VPQASDADGVPLGDDFAKAWGKPLDKLGLGGLSAKTISKLFEDLAKAGSPAKPSKIGDFSKFAFPMVADSIVSVQPMTSPVGGINFYRPKYGAKKTPLQQLAEEIWKDDGGDA